MNSNILNMFKTIREKTLHTYSLIMVALFVPFVSYGCDPGKLCNPLKNGMGISELVVYLVKDILVGLIAPIVITLALLYSGFMFVSAQGNEAKLAQAKMNFLYVIIGGVVLLGAYVILELVTNTVTEITGTTAPIAP